MRPVVFMLMSQNRIHRMVLGGPKSSFGFFHEMLQKNPSELLGQRSSFEKNLRQPVVRSPSFAQKTPPKDPERWGAQRLTVGEADKLRGRLPERTLTFFCLK